MIPKPSTKQAPKTVLDSERLKSLVTDLTEAKEGNIVGGALALGAQLRTKFKPRIEDYKSIA